MTRPSELLTSQTDPGALFLLARRFMLVSDETTAIRHANDLARIARHLPPGSTRTAYEQASGALREAVEVAREVKSDEQAANLAA